MTTQITSELLTKIKAELAAKIKEVADANNVTIQFGNGTYTDQLATLKLKIAGVQLNEGQSVRSVELANALRMARFRYPEINFDATYSYRDDSAIKIVGYNSRGRTTPFIIQCKNGRFKVSPDFIKSMKVVITA